jgi:molybdopterin-guanine dinucleotide biosynthesis protein A
MRQLDVLNFYCNAIPMENQNNLTKSRIAAFVFAGGTSSRFGSNKALFEIGGKPMIEWVAGNIGAAAQCDPIFVGTRDEASFSHSGVLIGKREGTGPLGALCDALDSVDAQFVLVAPCDTPFFSSESFARLVARMTHFAAVVAVDNERQDNAHWLLSCWHADACRKHLADQYDSGERAIHRAVSGLDIHFESFDERELRNINSPNDIE